MELCHAIETHGIEALVLVSSPGEAEAWQVCRASPERVRIQNRGATRLVDAVRGCAALYHCGGLAECTAAMFAGVPSVCVPSYGAGPMDQFWADALTQLGVAVKCTEPDRADAVAEALRLAARGATIVWRRAALS